MSFRRRLANWIAYALLAVTLAMGVLFAISHDRVMRVAAKGRKYTVAATFVVWHLELAATDLPSSAQKPYTVDTYRRDLPDAQSRALAVDAMQPLGFGSGFGLICARYSSALPAWAVLPIVAAWPAVWLGFLRRRLSVAGRCTQCGYDLRGTLAAGREVCPECGSPIATNGSAG